jgi:3-deoxy-7-phosphoheptulonate synthase/chorismate mutase
MSDQRRQGGEKPIDPGGAGLGELRREIDRLNSELLRNLNARARLVERIGELKKSRQLETYDPLRESQMLERIHEENDGPFSDAVVARLFQEIFRASGQLIDDRARVVARTSRSWRSEDTVVEARGVAVGAARPAVVIAGPCAVESPEQMERIAGRLAALGVRILRGGAFKPRTSPYSFQGLREEGLSILREVAARHGLATVTEVLDPRDVERVAGHADILQVGTRNMFNYELLRELGGCRKPLLIKRGFMATLEEFLQAVEYVFERGNEQIILCERGIRTFERWTRNTLDISAVPLLKRESHLPVIVDVSHSTGRRDIVIPVARASLAAGADGVMVEVHDQPEVALSDSDQQLDLREFAELLEAIRPFLENRPHGS